MSGESILLSEARCGDRVKIVEFLGSEEVLKKIEAMGLRKGSDFEVMHIFGRNLLLRNGTNRLVISLDIARNIKAELLERIPRPCEMRGGCRKRRGWGWRWRWGWKWKW